MSLGSLLSYTVEELTYQELLCFASDPRRVHCHELAVTLQPKLVLSAGNVTHAEILTLALAHVGIVLLHLEKVSNRGNFLRDKVVHNIVLLVVPRESLNRPDCLLVTPAGISSQSTLLCESGNQVDKLLEVPRLGLPVLDRGPTLTETSDGIIDSWCPPTDGLSFDELGSLSLGQLVAELKCLHELDTGPSCHVQRQDFFIPDRVGLVWVPGLKPCKNGALVQVEVLEAKSSGGLHPDCGDPEFLSD